MAKTRIEQRLDKAQVRSETFDRQHRPAALLQRVLGLAADEHRGGAGPAPCAHHHQIGSIRLGHAQDGACHVRSFFEDDVEVEPSELYDRPR